jgi:ankyrin repeat protein
MWTESLPPSLDTLKASGLRSGEKVASGWLLDHQAEINPKDEWGKTPLQYAAAQSNEDVVDLLRQHGGQ